jgi:hypothetical protein
MLPDRLMDPYAQLSTARHSACTQACARREEREAERGCNKRLEQSDGNGEQGGDQGSPSAPHGRPLSDRVVVVGIRRRPCVLGHPPSVLGTGVVLADPCRRCYRRSSGRRGCDRLSEYSEGPRAPGRSHSCSWERTCPAVSNLERRHAVAFGDESGPASRAHRLWTDRGDPERYRLVRRRALVSARYRRVWPP